VSGDGTALRTAGGFELEQVLSEAYPILRAVDPQELFTIVHTLAEAGDGLGPTINRSLVNGAAVLDVSASRTTELAQFLEDLAALSDELSGRAPDLIAGAEDLNVALPALTDDPDALGGFLREAARLSEDISDLLDANTGFIDSVYSDGQAVLDTLYAGRAQLVPLIIGLRQYAETAGGAARIPVPNGTLMAAVKGLLGGELCGIVPCTGALAAGTAAAPTLPADPDASVGDILDQLGLGDINGQVSSGTQAIVDLVTGLLRGPH
jgi:ABC-type transporter Mla subunit MlaD